MANELSQRAIKLAWDTGHFWSFPNDVTQDKLHLLTPDDPVVVKAMISMAKANATAYTTAVLDEHGRLPQFDGVIGPAMLRLINTQRCMVPDYAPPAGVSFTFEDPHLQQVCERMQSDTAQAIGSGNWAGCHNIGNFHCATIRVDDSYLPLFLKPVWKQVITNVRLAYAGVGLLWKFIDRSGNDLLTGERSSGNINTDMSFVSSSSGWIGLAIVGQNETCSSKIWCRFLNTYKGGSTNDQIIAQWTTLLKHELGHNCGRSHTNGGVMNPSIVNNLPTEWTSSDPSTSWLQQQFGGVPVPIPGGGNTPLPPDTPKTIEDRLHAQEVINAVQSATIDWLVAKERARGN